MRCYWLKEFEKHMSRKLKISAKTAMGIAEKLYTAGYVSYPRTETNKFPHDFNLRELVQQQTGDAAWGGEWNSFVYFLFAALYYLSESA